MYEPIGILLPRLPTLGNVDKEEEIMLASFAYSLVDELIVLNGLKKAFIVFFIF